LDWNVTKKIVIMTGSTGLGAAAAKLAAEGGAQVLVATGDEPSGILLAEATKAELWVGDVNRPGAAESVLAQCLSKFGRVDGLFHSVGLSGRRWGDGPVHECTDEGWEVTLAQNLTGMFRMCRAVIGRMLDQPPGDDGIRGAIVLVGSVLTESPEPKHFATHAYAAAKGAAAAMTRSMAAYYAAHQIRVNAIAPGMVRTPASERMEAAPELATLIARKQPLAGGLMDAMDAARTAVFLLSSEARVITGQVLTVDAGWSVSSSAG
jgi:NAD(P)-dependent dehydrogenase (short-subunit alcohol dehydrogenase family)